MKRGFTLIEVCLVMLVFGIAISSIMAFFPVSLRQANTTVSDAVVTTFADYVINALQANAAKMTDWNVWQDPEYDKEESEIDPQKSIFVKAIIDEIKFETETATKSLDCRKSKKEELEGYLGVKKSYIGYQLEFRKAKKGRLWQIILYVTDNKHLLPKKGQTFITHVVYLGEAPE